MKKPLSILATFMVSLAVLQPGLIEAQQSTPTRTATQDQNENIALIQSELRNSETRQREIQGALTALRKEAGSNAQLYSSKIQMLADANAKANNKIGLLQSALTDAEAAERKAAARQYVETANLRSLIWLIGLVTLASLAILACLFLLKKSRVENAGDDKRMEIKLANLKSGATLPEIEIFSQQTGLKKFPYSYHLKTEGVTIHGQVEFDEAKQEWIFEFGGHRANGKNKTAAAVMAYRDAHPENEAVIQA